MSISLSTLNSHFKDYFTFFNLFFVSTLIKILLTPGYKSTDFEVHRNWLAVTNKIPIRDWYYNEASEWTLDYPPFFAYFEFVLSQLASVWDPLLLHLGPMKEYSSSIILFQRFSVMASDLFLFIGFCACKDFLSSTLDKFIACVLIFLNPGFLIVDHVHFQYNGLLFGILLFTFGCFKKRNYLLGAASFASLLMFKHLFLYIAPVVFIYLLSASCFRNDKFHLRQFCLLGITVFVVFSIALVPFIHHIPQLFKRLFPFQRGLCHAYWAPNFWALYLFLDRCFCFVFRASFSTSNIESSTRGLVGDINFNFLPAIKPIHTFILTVLLMVPFLNVLWKRSNQGRVFLNCITLCGFVSFLVGWHVHEKAILTVWIPFSLIALDSLQFSQVYFAFSVLSTYSLFPLLFEPLDTALCWTLIATFHAFLYLFFYARYNQTKIQMRSSFVIPRPMFFYLSLIIPLELFRVIAHPLLLKGSWAFLPLMLVSVYCSLGFLGIFWLLSHSFFTRPDARHKKQN